MNNLKVIKVEAISDIPSNRCTGCYFSGRFNCNAPDGKKYSCTKINLDNTSIHYIFITLKEFLDNL
jgi:hypothetical protein